MQYLRAQESVFNPSRVERQSCCFIQSFYRQYVMV